MILEKIEHQDGPFALYQVTDIRSEDILPTRKSKRFMKFVRGLGKEYRFLNWFTMPEFDRIVRKTFCEKNLAVKNDHHELSV